MDYNKLDSDLEKMQSAGASKDEMSEYISLMSQPSAVPDLPAVPASEGGVFSNISDDLSSRQQQVSESMAAYRAGEQGLPSTALQAVGAGMGGTMDVIGEGVGSALSGVTPDFIEKPVVGAIKSGVQAVADTDTAQGLMKWWDDFSKENPVAAKNIGALTNIGLVAAPAAKVPPTRIGGELASRAKSVYDKMPKDVLKGAADKLRGAATNQELARKTSFIDEDLLMPKQTAKVKEAQVKTGMEEGLRYRKPVQTAQQKEISDVIVGIDGVNSSNSLIKNYNIIEEANKAEAEYLESAIKASNVKIPRKDITKAMKVVVDNFKIDAALVGNPGKSAKRLLLQLNKHLGSKKTLSASEVFEARKWFDKLAIRSKPKVFDNQVENAFSSATTEVRNVLNEMVDNRVLGVDVKGSLRRQSKMFQAMDIIAPKAAQVETDKVVGAVKGLFEKLPMKSETAKLLMASGIGAGATAASLSPAAVAPFATAAGMAYVGGKMIISPKSKKALAKLIDMADMAIKSQKHDIAFIKKIKGDRALLIEALKNSETKKGNE